MDDKAAQWSCVQEQYQYWGGGGGVRISIVTGNAAVGGFLRHRRLS